MFRLKVFILSIVIVLNIIDLVPLTRTFEIGFSEGENSYAKYEKWNASTMSSFRLKFNTPKRTGLLAYIDDRKGGTAHYLLIALHSGELKVLVKMGEENDVKMKSLGDSLNDLEWHELEIVRNYRATTIILDNMENIIISSGKNSMLEVSSFLYIGGTPTNVLTREEKPYQQFGSFVGCIKDVEVRYGKANYQTPAIITTTHNFGCPNKCSTEVENFHCGLGNCKNNYIKASCDCFGTEYVGDRCEKRSSSYQLNGFSFIAFNERNLRHSSANKLEFRFRTLLRNGIIFTGGKSHDFWTVEMFRGRIRLSGDIGGGTMTISAGNGYLHDGRWHSVRITQKGALIFLNIDDKYNDSHSNLNGFSVACNGKDELDTFFVGGHFNVIYARSSLSKAGFKGCLQKFFFRGEDILSRARSSTSSDFKVIGSLEDNCAISPNTTIGMSGTRNGYDRTTSSMRGRGKYSPKPGSNGEDGNLELGPETEERSGKRLSQSTVGWITAGIVTGSIGLILAVAFLVRHFKRKYSGSFVATSLNQNDYSSVHLYGGQPAYYVSNGKPSKGTQI